MSHPTCRETNSTHVIRLKIYCFQIIPENYCRQYQGIVNNMGYIWTKIEISSKNRAFGRISGNDLAKSIPEMLENGKLPYITMYYTEGS